MKPWKNATYSILFGIVIAIVSCSAIKLTRRNISIQSQDTTKKEKYEVPAMPAVNLVPASTYTQTRKADLRLFKDSLINGLKSIKKSVDEGNSKMDTSLQNQTKQLQNQSNVIATLFDLSATIKGLKLDTARLYKKATISTEIKNDADFGNTFKTFALLVLSGILLAIFIIVICTHIAIRKLNKKISSKANAT